MAVTLPRPDTPTEREPATEPRPWRFTVDEYHRMIDVGILAEGAPVELIQGALIQMSAMNGAHVECSGSLTALLFGQVGNEVRIHVQLPVRLPGDSEPEPDFSLVRIGYGRRQVPDASDVFLAIEVPDSSLRHDRTVKLPLYAAAGIPEAWIFDLTGDRIERHTDPGPNGYQQIALAGRGKALPSTVLPAITLSIDAVLPVAE